MSAATSNASITVIQLSGESMQFTNAMDLFLQKLPPKARVAHSLPELTNNLLSVAFLCDAGCEVFFHTTGCEVTHNGAVILRGWREPHHCLWRVHIIEDSWTTNHRIPNNNDSNALTAVAHSLYNCNNAQQLVQFYHNCRLSPVKSTLITAISRGYLQGFPGLTAQRTLRHITINNATEKGHMDQT
jgi:hypothetical protein